MEPTKEKQSRAITTNRTRHDDKAAEIRTQTRRKPFKHNFCALRKSYVRRARINILFRI